MIVQSLENLEKSENKICVRENLEKSGNFTEIFTGIFTESKIIFHMYFLLETTLFQIRIPLAFIWILPLNNVNEFLKILSGKPGKVRETHTCQLWTTMVIVDEKKVRMRSVNFCSSSSGLSKVFSKPIFYKIWMPYISILHLRRARKVFLETTWSEQNGALWY